MSVKEYRVTRTRDGDHLRSDATDDSWVSLCSDACERVAFPEDFVDGQNHEDAQLTLRLSRLPRPGAAVAAGRENHAAAPRPLRRAAQAGVATITQWCHTRLVGKGHE